MSELDIDKLFDRNRLPGGWQLFLLCLYFPIGLILTILRLFIGLNTLFASCIIPRVAPIRSYILRTLCLILGILIKEENAEEKDPEVKMLVANHTCMFDHLAVDLVLPCVMPRMSDLPQILCWCFGFKDFGRKQGQETFVDNIKTHCLEGTNVPILCYPEGATTNGRAGLLKFSLWPFCLDQPINPIVITVTRPFFFNVSLSVLGSPWWADLFWFFFTPFTTFTLRYLPVMRKGTDETENDFAKRVQITMASELKLEATNLTVGDKNEHVKKILLDQNLPIVRSQQSRRGFSENVNEFNTMVDQVREVLPNVPLEVIRRDLMHTRNVDVTITNVLEGEISFVPEELRQSTSSRSTVSEPTPSSSSSVNDSFKDAKSTLSKGSQSLSVISNPTGQLETGASTFGKTAEERMLSFQERKHRLIEHARQRYLEKHDV